ncbi:type II secretion system protein GspF [Legionella israelensis]|uniref:type II secretion system inner membrane protein GspF n=1 Tax=Legionella israelensis TaxID=454 RepID=UPI001180AC18|nr:type II secretion system inner membrane protein GspF [Legionella israelensis]QDP72763.1 type II secretion system protein GspF [Legionella israelensis]
MGAYQYQAIKKSGSSDKGVIEADSERHARQLLREQGLIPTQITLLSRKKATYHKNKIASGDLSLLTRQLATLLSAGIPVEEALKGVSEQTEKTKVSELIIGVRAKVLEGYSLAQAMDQYPVAFPELYRATVGAGEQTGRLDIVLEKLADYTENQQQTKQKIQQALIYPSLMVMVSVAIISFLLAFVVPKIIEVFTGSGQTLPGFTQILINISSFVKNYGLYLLLFLIIVIIGFHYSLKNKQIKTRWHKFLLKLPLISYLVRSVNVSRYIHTFGILFAAGVNILETMKVSASLINNLVIRNEFDDAAIKVREGTSISKALKETSFLSPMAVHLIASGEKSGQIASMMERTARHLDSEVKRLIDTALTLLEPFIILLMGAVVLFIVLATLLPIFSMEQLVV